MRYVICAKSPDTARYRPEGRWVVEAASREEAIRLMERHINAWPKGSTWTVKPWTPNGVKLPERRRHDADNAFPRSVPPLTGFVSTGWHHESY